MRILGQMEGDPRLQERSDDLRLQIRNLQSLLAEMNETLDLSHAEPSTEKRLDAMDRLQGLLQETIQSYLAQNAAFVQDLREQMRRIEEANREAVMAKKEPRSERDQAKIQQLSAQLATDLRLERIDNAIKELLEFLSDAEFFSANASTGRRRRLRSLQNAIEKALQK